ncbi:tetratricopeptide repeat protein [bacterium SCSIO 12741]|nr:tetratricopeptide repeat protein [bacterium SCSIO 12741]
MDQKKAISSPSIPSENALVYGFLTLYLLLSLIWHFTTHAPWDDDCVSRYYNVVQAAEDPVHFVEVWNRPLFVLLFFIPMMISRHGVLLMAIISAGGAFALYKAARKLELRQAWLVVPFLLFEAFFFTISRSALAEPLATAILCFSLWFYYEKRFFWFALVGSLIPLARLEMSILWVFWAYVLIRERQWKFLFMMGIPIACWSLAGSLIEGGAFWLYDETLGKENSSNRYGHTTLGHYFQRYIYVIGPVVFYFLFIGMFQRIRKKTASFALEGLFILGFCVYVLFSWKLNLGQAAGFVRHLVVLSPMATLLALYGFDFWYTAATEKRGSVEDESEFQWDEENERQNLANRIEEIQLEGTRRKRKSKAIRYEIRKVEKEFEKRKLKLTQPANATSKTRFVLSDQAFILLITCLILLVTLAFHSQEMLIHHNLTDDKDYLRAIYLGVILLVFLFLMFYSRKRSISSNWRNGMALFMGAVAISYTLFTEPPNSHNSDEREMVRAFSDLYTDGFFGDENIYTNHFYFFWANDIYPYQDRFPRLTQQNIDEAPDSSYIIWENHYSNRLMGDVPVSHFEDNPDYVVILLEDLPTTQFRISAFQKLPNATPYQKIDIYNRFLSINPNFKSPYINRARVLQEEYNKYELAIQDYERALAIDPDIVFVHYNIGMCYFHMNQLQKAYKSFYHSYQLDPEYADAYFNAGLMSNRIGDHGLALENYNKAIRLNPNLNIAHYSRAYTLVSMGRHQEAIPDYDWLIEQKTSYMRDAYYSRGTIKCYLGQIDQGCADLQKALQMNHAEAASKLSQYCGTP